MLMRKLTTEQKRAKVGQVARQLFIEKGFHGVTIPEIVHQSGVSTGSVYNYFGSKLQLASALYDEARQLFCVTLEALLEEQVGAYNRLKTVVTLLFDLVEDDPVLVEYLFWFRHQEYIKDYQPVFTKNANCSVYQIIEQGMAEGDLSDGDPLLKSLAFVGVVLSHIDAVLKGVINLSNRPALQQHVMQCAWNTVGGQ